MRLREIFSVLSKSSPYAVTTERKTQSHSVLDDVKDYLYIKTEIEADFQRHLQAISASEKKVIFLCGSSGDGKSEILSRYRKNFSEKADFHPDATHSFHPQETAIERLDKLFDAYFLGNKSLVVGINIGMLGNYAEEGRCQPAKLAIKQYLEHATNADGFIFLDFEQYPKFKLESHRCSSDFAEKLLQRITAQDNNIIRKYYDEELARPDADSVLCMNYHLLSLPSVQRLVVECLFKARLIKDQFLTARALLDFIYHLFTGPGYISENLFTCEDSEIAAKIADFDPALLRTELIDQFVLSQKLAIEESDYEEFKETLRSMNFDFRKLRSPESQIRLFYLLQNENIGNNYHHRFKPDLADSILQAYATIWHMHHEPEDLIAKQKLRTFYKDVLLTAISRYNNRNLPQLGKEEFLLSDRGGYQIVAKLDIKQDHAAIKDAADKGHENVSFFNAYLKLDGRPLSPIPININLMALLQRIVEGYQPSKHDKSAVVLLDEVIEELNRSATETTTLFIIRADKRFKLCDAEGDGTELEVGGG